MMKDRSHRLSIETDAKTGVSNVEVVGNAKQLIFNLTALTAQVCEEIGIPPEVWALALPEAIETYKNVFLKSKIRVGLNPLKNGGDET